MRYVRLKFAVSEFKYKEAVRIRNEIKTNLYKSKKYSKYLTNYMFFIFLFLYLKFIGNEN